MTQSTKKWLCIAALGCVLITIGVALRVVVMDSVFGAFNADEASSGLHSLAAIRDGRLPVVIAGQSYTAVLDAYLFSPILNFADGSVAVLKWLFVGMWAVAAAATFGATRRLVDRRSAALASALVWLAPGGLLLLSTLAYMGYALALAVAAGTVWATAIAADQVEPTIRQSALVGFLAGLGFYVHPMFATVLLPVVCVAAFVHRRDLRRWWLPAVAAAVTANGPFIAWNAMNGWPSLQKTGTFPGTYSDRFTGFFTKLLPRGLGLLTLDGRWVFNRALSIGLFVAILLGVVAGCVMLATSARRPSRWIVPAGLIACFPLMALMPPLIFSDDGRYAIIPFALMAIALGTAATRVMSTWSLRSTVAAIAGAAVLWVGITAIPFLDRQQGFDSGDPNAWQDRVINRLDELDIELLAGYYWFVLPIEYRTDREIRTAISCHPYTVRFPSSQILVQQAPPESVAFLFPPGDHDPSCFYLPQDSYKREDLGGMTLYVPISSGT
ncbi:MAG: hypothetical protein K8R99_12320 [Actinomycetia bacterium]|nr:hypothetical protein [Actinomycetes bacterium]